MSITKLKKKLIAQINEIENEDLLAEITTMLYIDSRSTNRVYQMSDEEREAVEEGIEQINNGQSISHEEARKHFEELLKKKESL
jgi:hypothetical protein